MELDETLRDAVMMAAEVKMRMVNFATSPPFERHLRRLYRDTVHDPRQASDPEVKAIERLLFEFRYDDDTTVVDRFIRLPTLTEVERDIAVGFTQGVDGVFEVLTDTPTGALVFEVRCCLSDLGHVVAPTEPAGLPALTPGSFLVGRLNPIAETHLWTPSGALQILPASQRESVAEAVMNTALRAPWLTHRNPEKAQAAAEHVAMMHKRFIDRHGRDLILVEGRNLAAVYAEAVAPLKELEPEAAAHAEALARQTIEDSELVEAASVALLSHPVAGFSFYLDFERVTRALESGAEVDLDDLEYLRGYIDDEGVPAWLLRRLVEERLPTSADALAEALQQPDFDWERDGAGLLASSPGDPEPVVTLSIVPSMCTSRM